MPAKLCTVVAITNDSDTSNVYECNIKVSDSISTICDALGWICMATHLPLQILNLDTYMSRYVDAGLGEIFRAILVLNDVCGKLQIRMFLWMPVSLLCLFILISQSLDIQSPLPQVKASQDIDSKTSHWSCDRFKPTWFIHSLFHLKRGIPTGWKEFHHVISQQNISRR